jgi:hypothetical protein
MRCALSAVGASGKIEFRDEVEKTCAFTAFKENGAPACHGMDLGGSSGCWGGDTSPSYYPQLLMRNGGWHVLASR